MRADDLRVVSWQMQLCAAALLSLRSDDAIDKMLCANEDGNEALHIALRREAKVFLSQHIVCKFMQRTWRGSFTFTVPCAVRLLFQLPLLVLRLRADGGAVARRSGYVARAERRGLSRP